MSVRTLTRSLPSTFRHLTTRHSITRPSPLLPATHRTYTTRNMGITELAFTQFKTDEETQSQLKEKAPQIFGQFRGVGGLKSLFRGAIIREHGETVEPSSGRSVFVLEWDQASSFHAFYPESDAFKGFIGLAKPLVAAPAVPELFETSTRSAPCSSAAVTQIVKATQTQGTHEAWNRLQSAVSATKTAKPAFFCGTGIGARQDTFLGMIGWQSLQDYEDSRTDQAVLDCLKALDASGKIQDVAAQLTPINF